MLLAEELNKIPNWSLKWDINRWCDYIELRCLGGKDKIITKDEVMDWFLQDKEDKGQENYASSLDKLTAEVDDLFNQIRYRSNNIDVFYPFNYEIDCLTKKDNIDKNMTQYIFLLVASSTVFIDRSSMILIAKEFEEYCVAVFKYLVSEDSEVHIFGTSRKQSIFRGNLRTRIEKLASCLGAQTTKAFDNDKQFDVPGGDEGIDMVAFNKIDDTSHIPVAFGQCTCSYSKWQVKQEEINQDAWVQKIMPLAPFGKYMFVSFFCRDAIGRFENPTTITTCLIDRLRILKIINKHHCIYDGIDCEDQRRKLVECCGEDFTNGIY